MVMRLFKLALCWLCLASLPAWAASFTAQVDRNKVAEQDSFTLVLRYGGQAFMSEPKTDALSQDFQIINQQRSQQFSSVNGKTESFTNWIITLSPKRTGTLIIPPIEFDGQTSQPIEITVTRISEEAKQQAEQDFFFETQIEPHNHVFVQSQLLYTEKFYYRYSHDNATLTDLKVTDAKVQALGDIRRYNTVLNGVQFGVYERQYAIFPEVSGELVIPGSRFSANLIDRYSWGRGRPVSAVAKPIKLQVEPIPANYPKNAVWLPTRKFTLSEQFSTPPSQWQAGEAITRTFTLSAEGLAGSSLPVVQLPVVDGVRYYPDQPNTDDQASNLGLLGRSEQSIAMVITQAGELVLPEVRIPWWNTQTKKLEYAVLPSRTVMVKAAAANAQTIPIAPAPIPTIAAEPASPAAAKTTNTQPAYWLWGITTLLLLSVLANILLLLRLRQTPRAVTSTPTSEPALKAQWQAFAHACKRNDPALIRQQLLAWVNAGGLNPLPLRRPVASLAVLAQTVQQQALALALRELDATLFAPQANSAFNAQQLKQLLEQEEKLHLQPTTAGLYPGSRT